ncbi:MAG: acyl-CoA dehydrogenase family protein, partial [Prochlorococcaceae cyanobacterium]
MTAPSISALDLAGARLGIIGGSGLYGMEGLEDLRELSVETPFGPPSDSLRIGRIGSLEVVFLARHGRHHTLTPTEVPFQANLWALRSQGVRWILSVSAVGSLQERYRPLDMLVPDQFIDRTHHRPASFFGVQPLLEGKYRSCFSMTEPTAGADPTLLSTRAVRDGDEWVINGHKWFSSNASIADFLIVMARTGDDDTHAYQSFSMFIVPTDTPGVNILRDVPTMGEPDHRTG